MMMMMMMMMIMMMMMMMVTTTSTINGIFQRSQSAPLEKLDLTGHGTTDGKTLKR